MADPLESAGARRWRLFLWLCAAWRGDPVAWPADPADSDALLALAGEHFFTPALSVALADAPGLPPAVRDYLDAVAFLNRARNAQIMAAVDEAAACLAAAGIPAVFLKGAAQLADGLYRDPAARFMGDVDVLVPRRAQPAAASALADVGFSERDVFPRRLVPLRVQHLPMQRHAESGVGIEIHHVLLSPAHQHLLSAEAALRTAVPATARPNVFVPTVRLRVLHAILHDQLGHDGWLRWRCGLRTLSDLALLLARPDAGFDGATLTADLPAGTRRVTRHMLALSGLVGVPDDAAATERASLRLRHGYERPAQPIRDRLLDLFLALRFQPAAAINLLDPRRWPDHGERLRRRFA